MYEALTSSLAVIPPTVAMQGREALLGPGHPDTQASQANLEVCLAALGRR